MLSVGSLYSPKHTLVYLTVVKTHNPKHSEKTTIDPDYFGNSAVRDYTGADTYDC